MKTKIPKIAAVAATLSMMAGCIVLSVYPFYTAKDLVFDPALTGHWVDASKTNSNWRFAGVDGKWYWLATTDESSTNVFEGHLFQLKNYRFLDLLTTNRVDFHLPMHLISKVEHQGTNVSVQFMDYNWLDSELEKNPAALRHIVVPTEPGHGSDLNYQGDKMVYLTAETKDLQKFLLKHVEDTNAFNVESAIHLKPGTE
jgi:hypothetical protein